MARVLFSCLFLLALSACASSPTNTESREFKDTTTIQGSFEQESPLTWYHIKILSVDSSLMDYGLFDGFGKTFVISPGDSRIAVELEANGGFGSACPCKGIESFKLVTKPGHAYRVRAEMDDDKAKLWIEDLATNQPVTEIKNLRPRGS